MSWVQAARTRLRLLLRRDAADARMRKEFEFHIEMETERLIRDEKLDLAEARRRALIAFGGIETHKESLRDGRGLPWLNGLSLDLKLGLRMLVKYPGLTLVGVVGIAVAVGIGAVSFSGIYTIIDGHLPLDQGDRIVAIQNHDASAVNEGRRTHLHDLATWREGLSAVSELGAYRTVDRNLITPGSRPEPVRIAEMTATGFRIARVPPLMGRYLHDDDERAGAPPVVVIGYDVWQNRFAGRSDIIGRTVQLGDVRHTIIGVMPEGFAFPINNRIWTPLQLSPSNFERGDAPAIEVFGRLAAKATLADAEQQIQTIGQRLASEYPDSHQNVRPQIWPYARSVVETPELAWAFHLIQVMISMLLVVIGTNVAILVYARTASRAGEIAVRTALGASRARIVAQLFAEAFVLSTLAAAVGVGGARIALRQIDGYLTAVAGEQRPFWWHFGITPGVILYAAGLAVLGAVIVGLLPGLRATRTRVHPTLQQHGLGGSAFRLGKTWTFLIVAQVAVAIAALPMAIQGGRVWLKLQNANLTGGVASRVVATSLVLDRQDRPAPRVDGQRTVVGKIAQLGTTFGTADAADRDFAIRYENLRIELIRRLEVEPAVASVTVASTIPGNEPTLRIEVEGRATTVADTSAPTGAGTQVAVSRIDPGFFGALDIPVLAGRPLGITDASSEAPAVVVNRRFTQLLLGGRSPLGLRVRQVARVRNGSPEHNEPWQQIVGVVSDFPQAFDTTLGVQPRMYRVWTPGDGKPVTLIVRARGKDPGVLAARLRELTVAVHPMLRLGNIATIDETIRQGMAADNVLIFAAMLVTMSVLLLSAAGIYALTSFTITRRRREIGIRSALGAGPGRVLADVLSKTARQLGVGMLVGMVLATLTVAAFKNAHMTTSDFLLLAAVAGTMATIGLVAVIGPARRALRIQPTEALKAE